ncbi:FKBP-type peptidyl-prolyl cis-trans isomerase [Nitrospira sp. M1]
MVRVQQGDRVRIHLAVSLEDETVIEATDSKQPLTFTQGEGNVLPSVEQAVLGMALGETKTLHITEKEAFGPYSSDLIVQLDRSEFDQRDIHPEIGLEIETKQANGVSLVARVTDVSETKVTMDANHPYAGHTLTCNLLLTGID